jgi:hypothetical protein
MHHVVLLLFPPRTALQPPCCAPAFLGCAPMRPPEGQTPTREPVEAPRDPARQTRHGRTASRFCVACNVRRTRPMCVQNVPGAVCVVCGGATFPRRTHIFGTSVLGSNMHRQRDRFVFNIVLLVTLSCESSLDRRIGCDECAFACCLAPNTCFIQGRLLAEVRRRCVN